MKTLELNKMGLTPMNEFEMEEVDGGGGGIWGFVKDYLIGKAVDFVVDSMAEDWKHRKYCTVTERYMHHGPY